MEETILRTGLEFAPFGERDFPVGSAAGLYSELGKRKGIAAMKYIINWFAREAAVMMAEAPALIRAAGVDLLPGPNGEWYVLEVNAVPGWRALAPATGVDVALELIRFVAT